VAHPLCYFPLDALHIELALALPQPARGVRILPILNLVHIMTANGSLGFLTAVFVLIWRALVTLNSVRFPRTSQRSLDEDFSLLQLAEAFARKIERERALIAEKVHDPETIRDVSPR
jgi:hypothetical protein